MPDEVVEQETPKSKKKRAWPWIVAWVLLFFKVDDILWGFMGLPAGTVFSIFGALLCAGALLISWGKPWTTLRRIALLAFLTLQPLYPSGTVPYVLGFALRVKCDVNIPAVVQWAKEYKFRQTATDPEVPEYREYELVTENPPPSVKGLGMVSISRKNRSVSVSVPIWGIGHGLIVGPAARKYTNEINYLNLTSSLKLGDDAGVWASQAGN